jgi:RNA polymerase sigma-70 factor, ECF subfamily
MMSILQRAVLRLACGGGSGGSRRKMKDSDTSLRRKEVETGLPPLLKRLWRYGLVLSGDSDMAHELVQATCLRALEKCEQFQPGTQLSRWAYTILSSIWKNELRSRKVRMGQGFVDPEIALVADGIREMDLNLLARQVLKEVERLPEGQREAVFLVYGEGLSYREAAEILDVPQGTIMSRLAAARQKLAELRDQGDHLIPAE